MRKLIWAAIMAAMLIVLAGCTVGNTSVVFDDTCATGYAFEGSAFGKRCMTDAELQLGRDELAKLVGTGSLVPMEQSGYQPAGSGETPAPAAVPTAVPTSYDVPLGDGQPAAPAQPAYSGGNWQTAGYDDKEGAMSLCISDQKMMQETGLTRVIDTIAPGDWETCKWQVIPDGESFNLPADGRYTGRMLDGTHVLWVGPVQVPPSFEGTLRLARGYVVNSFAQTPCDYAAHEVGYADNLRTRTGGEDNIMYSLGNFSCPALQGILPNMSGQGMSVDPPATVGGQCPTTPKDAAAQLGGKAKLWAQSPDDPSLWVYGGPDILGEWTSDDVKFRYPGYGWYEWWQRPGEQLRESFPVDETTFHCE